LEKTGLVGHSIRVVCDADGVGTDAFAVVDDVVLYVVAVDEVVDLSKTVGVAECQARTAQHIQLVV
jgi:hypothetical protein